LISADDITNRRSRPLHDRLAARRRIGKSDRGCTDEAVLKSTYRAEEVWSFFEKNGYSRDELAHHFSNQACWFAAYDAKQLQAACFVFRNYKDIWEIAGVYTKPEHRRKGHGKRIVTAVLSYLASQGLVLRYQAKSDNNCSIKLAEACGMKEFLVVDYFVLEPERD